MIPKNFPVGRLRGLLGTVTPTGRGRSPLLPKAELISPFGGVAPRYRMGSSLDADRRTIHSRGDGTLSQIVAAKSSPTSLSSPRGPVMETGSLPPDLMNLEMTGPGGSKVRDAMVDKAAEDKTAKKKPTATQMLADPRLALQTGMSKARKFMWKQMSPGHKAHYMLHKMLKAFKIP